MSFVSNVQPHWYATRCAHSAPSEWHKLQLGIEFHSRVKFHSVNVLVVDVKHVSHTAVLSCRKLSLHSHLLEGVGGRRGSSRLSHVEGRKRDSCAAARPAGGRANNPGTRTLQEKGGESGRAQTTTPVPPSTPPPSARLLGRRPSPMDSSAQQEPRRAPASTVRSHG